MKKFYFLIAALCLGLTAQAEVINDINYEIQDDGDGNPVAVVVANDPAYEGDIVIPSEVVIDGVHYPVTTIGSNAFAFCEGMTSISLPEGLKAIDIDAFWNCIALTQIDIPSTVTYIESWAFEGCSGLTSFTLPDNVTYVGYNAFVNCTGIKNPIFNKHFFVMMPDGFEGEYVIQDGIEKVCSNAFYNVYGLTAITLPNSLKEIGSFAFQGTSIESLEIPASVEEIGESAFAKCGCLKNLSFAPSGTGEGLYIRREVFNECTQLERVSLSERLQYIEWRAFANCSLLREIHFPASVTYIGNSVCFCPALETITVAAGNPNYDSRNNCNAVINTAENRLEIGCKNTVIPNSVTCIAGEAFEGSGITSITIPASVKEIGCWAFSYCSDLTSFTLPNTVEMIEYGVFYGTNIPYPVYNDKWFCYLPESYSEEYTIPDGIEHLTGFAFGPYVPKINMPASLKEIGYEAFICASALKEIILPDNVETIGMYAFDACTNLKTVRLSKNMKKVEDNIFWNLDALDAIYNPQETPIDIENGLWQGERDPKEVTLYVPAGSVEAYTNHAKWGIFTVKADPSLGIDEVMTNDAMTTKTRKVLHDGKLYIIRDNQAYNFEGKQVK